MLKRIAAPAEPAVSLQEFKDQLGGNLTDTQDADLQGKLNAALADVQSDLGPYKGYPRPLITSTWEMRLAEWPCRGYVDLPANTQSIVSVKYTTSAGVEKTLATTVYKLTRAHDPESGDSDAGPGRLCLAFGQSWPTDELDVGEPIVIRLVAGWKDAASVPDQVKHAVLMLASHFFRNRDAIVVGNTAASVSSETAMGVKRLLAPFRDERW